MDLRKDNPSVLALGWVPRCNVHTGCRWQHWAQCSSVLVAPDLRSKAWLVCARSRVVRPCEMFSNINQRSKLFAHQHEYPNVHTRVNNNYTRLEIGETQTLDSTS
eukprot:1656820-Amphidinium_carterae.1